VRRVFVVEDEAIVALEIQDHLRGMGYEVCGHATRGEVAVRQIPEVRPDLVLMDIKLGNGISGTETAERLRAVIDVPVLFLTAFSDAELTQRAGTTGAFGYLTKPFDPRVLAANIELALVRHAADLAMQASEARFSRVVEHVSDAIVVDDVHGLIVFANTRFLEMFGVPRDELYRQRIEDYVTPAWRSLLQDRRERGACGAQVSTVFERTDMRPDGARCWIDARVVAVCDRHGSIIGTQSVLRDVTATREAANALNNLRRHYEGIFNDALEGIFRTQLDGTIIDINDAFAKIVGYECAADLRGTNARELYRNPVTREQILLSGRGQELAEPVDVEWRKRNGDSITVEASGSVIRDTDGQPVAYQGFVRDVTEARARAAREKKLLAHNEQLELVIEGTRLGFWDWNPSTGAVTFNDRWAEMLGYRREELAADINACRSLIHPDDLALYDALMTLHLEGSTPYFEAVHRMRHRDGSWLHVLNRGKVFGRDEAGYPTRFCGTHTDITKEKVAEVAALEANRAKTQFLATMSHELRTPLNAVLGLSEALIERVYGDLTEKQERSLRTVHDSGKHLLTLINDVLDVARVEAGTLAVEPSDVVLKPLVAQCIALVRDEADARRQQLRTDLDYVGAIVRADPRRLKQMFLNLLTNAIKFSPKGATVTIGSTVLPGAAIELWVANPGPGIPAADRERIFEPFVRLEAALTREQPGAGLGLTIVQRIAELHGGTVRVEGEPGHGSKFVVKLPLVRGHGAVADRPPTQDGTDNPSVRREHSKHVVLLVEDSEANIDTISPYLEAKGYEVRVVRDGLSAVNAVAARDVSVVLMDISLPVISGLEAMQRIRAAESGAPKPIVALTAYAMPGDEQMCLAAGATCYLAKPLELKLLVQTINKLIVETFQQ